MLKIAGAPAPPGEEATYVAPCLTSSSKTRSREPNPGIILTLLGMLVTPVTIPTPDRTVPKSWLAVAIAPCFFLFVFPVALTVELAAPRSEEHTSELQSRVDISYAVF